MSARDAILARIRTRLRADPAQAEDRQAAVAAHIAARTPSPRPRPSPAAIDAFIERLLKLASTCERVASDAAVPAAVARYVEAHTLPPRAVCWPGLNAINWASAALDVEPRTARGEDRTGITGAYCAIAETGTLVVLSGPDTPGSVSLVPETHIAILQASRIVQGMEDMWALLRAEHGMLPRAVNFISGPSRTADIEQTVTLGVHGPARVHVILIG